MNTLHIGRNFKLPAEAVTQTFAILAKRGVGKTYTAKKMAEQMLKAAVAPVVIADPIGVWWGLRSSADGKSPGLPILVLGGEYGDVPLDVGAGELVASMLVEDRLSAVLDLSHFRKNEQTRFMTDFAERLYHSNRQALHLFLDEADAFAPQRPYKGQERLLGAIEDLVRRGRARGIGVTLITQRAAVVNKDVLTQAEVMVALRTIAPQDRAAIEAWIRVHGTEAEGDALMESLPSLPVGTAWFWSPGWLNVFQRVEVGQIETFDSSATPKAGKADHKPKQLAEVDIPAVREKLAAQIEKAKADDPRVLRTEIARLQAEVKKAGAATVISRESEIRKEAARAAHQQYLGPLGDAVIALEGIRAEATKLQSALQRAYDLAQFLDVMTEPRPPKPAPPAALPASFARSAAVETKALSQIAPRDHRENGGGVNLGGAQRVLKVLAQRHPMRVSRAQLATLSGLSTRGGTYGTYYSRLRNAGYLEESGGLLSCSPAGLAAAKVVPSQPQTTEELVSMWRSHLGGAGRMLDILVEIYPGQITRHELAEKLAMSAGGGTFGTYLSRLRSNGLAQVQGSVVRASDSLFIGR